jgi:hypothetical protein
MGVVRAATGATLRTSRCSVTTLDWPKVSSAVSVSAYVPSSLQVTCVVAEPASPNEHAPEPPDAAQLLEVAPFTDALAVNGEPSGTSPAWPLAPSPPPSSASAGGGLI